MPVILGKAGPHWTRQPGKADVLTLPAPKNKARALWVLRKLLISMSVQNISWSTQPWSDNLRKVQVCVKYKATALFYCARINVGESITFQKFLRVFLANKTFQVICVCCSRVLHYLLQLNTVVISLRCHNTLRILSVLFSIFCVFLLCLATV